MKKNLKMFVTCGVLFAAIPLMADTEKVSGYTWTYRINGDTAEIYGQTYPSRPGYYGTIPAVSPTPNGSLSIPSCLGGKPVTSIGERALFGCDSIKTVNICESVTSIGEWAFYGCSSLTNMTIPNSVVRIGYGAFEGCSGLKSVMIPVNVTSIGASAFSGCSGLTHITIPNSVTNINGSFYGCSGLTNVVLGSGVMDIGYRTFSGCSSLMNIVIPDNAKTIESEAFDRCYRLKSVTIGCGVTQISDEAFSYCGNLTNVIIRATNLVEVGGRAFPSCNCQYDESGNRYGDDCSYSFVIPEGGVACLPMLKRRYAHFMGWWTQPNGGVQLTSVSYAVPGQTYYAHWNRVKVSRIELAIPDTVTVWDDDWQKITIDEYNNVLPDFISVICDESGNVIEDWQEYCTIEIYYIWDLETPFQFDNYSGLRNLPGGEYVVKVIGDGTYCEGTATVPLTVCKRYDSYSWYDFTKWWMSVADFTYTPDTSYYPSSEYDGSTIDLGVYSADAQDRNTVRIYVDDNFNNDYGYYYGWGMNLYADVNAHRAGDFYDNTMYGQYIGNYYDPASMPIVNAGDYCLTISINGYLEHDDEYQYWREDIYGGQTFYIRLSPANFTNQTITTENAQSTFTGEGISPTNNGFRVSLSDPTTYYMENVTFTNAGVHAIRIGAATTECDMTCLAPDGESSWTEHSCYVTDYDYNGYPYWDNHLVFNYTGVVEVVYTVLPRPVAVSQARVVPRELHCDGTPQTCSFVITNDYNGAVLLEGRDYDVTYANNILAGTATATVTCKGNYTGTFSQSFEILPSTNVVEVLGLDKKWTTGGNAEWFAEWFEAAHDGVSCMRSGAIGDNQESWIETVVTNTGVVSFWWKASSEEYRGIAYDKAVFSVDGVEVASIGGEVDWTNVTYTVEGNGPHALRWTYRKDASDYGGEDCAWLDEVQYLREVRVTFEDGGATDGSVPAAMTVGEGLEITLPGQGALAWPKHSFSGWRINDDILAPGTPYTLGYDDVLFTAAWEEKKVSAPTIEVAAWYDTERTAVTMGCETVGAVIHYTLDGSTPTAESQVCTGSFYLAGSVTIKAIAVLDDYFDSDVVSAESVRAPWTPGECLNVPSFTFSIGGDATWFRDRTVTHDSDTAMRSGAIGDGQTSWIETSVSGAGTLTFWWKVSSEAYKGSIYDYARFTVDGDAAVPDIGGEIDWRCETVTITGSGAHTLRWAYVKDSQDKNGSDCAWLDEVTWMPAEPLPPLDPLPALDAQATDGDAAAIIGGLSDVRLSNKVVGTAAYTAFRNWVDGKGLSHAVVRDAPNAWLSYALDAPGLMAKTVALANEDVVIESITPSSTATGTFDLVVNIAGAEIGTAARLTEALGVEGATELNESAFSVEGLNVTLERTADGKAKAIVTPQGSPAAFFVRVKVK